MDWVLQGGRRTRQTHAARFAIDLWLDIRRRPYGKSHKVDLHITDPPFSYCEILELLPRESLPFIRSIEIQLDRDTLSSASTRLFLSRFPHLTDLKVDVVDRALASSGMFGPPSSTPVFVDDPLVSDDDGDLSLTSLSMVGSALSVEVARCLDMANITHLQLTDQVIGDRVHLSFFSILRAAPNIRHFTFHMHWMYPPETSQFWQLPTDDHEYASSLRSVDIAGDKRDVVGVVNRLTKKDVVRLTHINVTLFCDPYDSLPSFDEIAAFTTELTTEADHICVEGGMLRVSSKRSEYRADLVDWMVQWKLVTISHGFWVRYPIFVLAINVSHVHRYVGRGGGV